MAMYKIEYERDKCIGCKGCVEAAPKYWKMNKDNKSDLLGSESKNGIFLLDYPKEDELLQVKAARSGPRPSATVDLSDSSREVDS